MIIPTHIHDDHVCGIPYLQRHRETECWALEKVTKVLSEPARWSSTPCCYDRPIRIHRRLKDGEEFDWEEYTFRAYYFPGQTEFHSAITALIDGKKVAFTGDSVYERARATWGNTVKKRPMQTQIFRNGFQLSMHKKCQQVLRQIMPDLICPGHEEPFNFDRIKLEDYCDYIEQKEALFRELSPEPVEQYVDLLLGSTAPLSIGARGR